MQGKLNSLNSKLQHRPSQLAANSLPETSELLQGPCPVLVVDGYNLIFQRMGDRQLDWEQRREELISELSEYALLRKLQVSPDSLVSLVLSICTAALVDAKGNTT